VEKGKPWGYEGGHRWKQRKKRGEGSKKFLGRTTYPSNSNVRTSFEDVT